MEGVGQAVCQRRRRGLPAYRAVVEFTGGGNNHVEGRRKDVGLLHKCGLLVRGQDAVVIPRVRLFGLVKVPSKSLTGGRC